MTRQRFLLVLVVLAVLAVSVMGKVHHYTQGGGVPDTMPDTAVEEESDGGGLGLLGGVKELLDDVLSDVGVHNQ